MKLLLVYFSIFITILISSFRPVTLGNTYGLELPDKKGDNISDTFPVPKNNKNMAFYVQRTHNTNTIVYELNYNKDSTLNEKTPIHPYWIRYADNGENQELSYIQNTYAYGLVSKIIDPEKKTFKVNFVSYKKRDIFLVRAKNVNRYYAYITINGKLAQLERIFARIDGGTFWVPHITYVEITGKDLNGNTVSEKIIP